MILLIIVGAVLVGMAVVGFVMNNSGGASLIGYVVAETIAIPIAVAGVVLIIAGVLWK